MYMHVVVKFPEALELTTPMKYVYSFCLQIYFIQKLAVSNQNELSSM